MDDATRLEEELVDPPELDAMLSAPPAQTTQQPITSQASNQATNNNYGTNAVQPPTSSSATFNYDPNQAYGQGPGGLTGLDRIRPSDMADEGLVGVSNISSMLFWRSRRILILRERDSYQGV
jgi:hypothetical protein